MALSFVALPLRAQDSDKLVSYPMPPDTMMQLQPRCDYIVSRYWKRCRFDYAMAHPDKFNATFGDWVAILPHASADTVHAAIDELLGQFTKKGPETLALATMARNWLYADTSQYRSDEIYMPFAKAASSHKKLKKEDRAIFAADYKRMNASAVGQTLPELTVVTADGNTATLGEVAGSSVLIFFLEPDNVDCSLARIRLANNSDVRDLVERGELAVVCLYPAVPDDEWRKTAASMPKKWYKYAMPEAEDYFDLRIKPQFVYLNSAHTVLAKNMNLDYLLNAFAAANKALKQQASTGSNE